MIIPSKQYKKILLFIFFDIKSLSLFFFYLFLHISKTTDDDTKIEAITYSFVRITTRRTVHCIWKLREGREREWGTVLGKRFIRSPFYWLRIVKIYTWVRIFIIDLQIKQESNTFVKSSVFYLKISENDTIMFPFVLKPLQRLLNKKDFHLSKVLLKKFLL